MTIANSIPTDALLVAIDIAKVRNEVLIAAPGAAADCRSPTIGSDNPIWYGVARLGIIPHDLRRDVVEQRARQAGAHSCGQ